MEEAGSRARALSAGYLCSVTYSSYTCAFARPFLFCIGVPTVAPILHTQVAGGWMWRR
jgi:hypothetical protein